jgi:23S rRNA (cytosine1962-C5)-methyltransferase
MKARRYQLRKDAVAIVASGHPWIFREQMSSAANVLRDGEWLRLVDGQNNVIGYGIYESEGAIAIRMLRRGPEVANAGWLRGALDAAVAKRATLAQQATGIRLLHGESDGIPAVVVDRFGDTLVVSSYSSGADGVARYIAHALGNMGAGNMGALGNIGAGQMGSDPISGQTTNWVGPHFVVGPAKHVVIRPARRRRGPPQPARVLRGSPPGVVTFEVHGLPFAVDLEGGHKTGTYLDLRALRHALATMTLTGARVLNTFAYTGMLGRAAEAAGAASIVQVDQSERALAFAAAHHVVDASKHTFITADVFEWLPFHNDKYDVVICDPPSMTSKKAQVPNVLAAYKKLYRAAERLVAPGGLLVSACCTSRIERKQFQATVRAALPERFTLERDLPPEPDHPVGFPQADYLKILLWRSR